MAADGTLHQRSARSLLPLALVDLYVCERATASNNGSLLDGMAPLDRVLHRLRGESYRCILTVDQEQVLGRQVLLLKDLDLRAIQGQGSFSVHALEWEQDSNAAHRCK